MIKKIDANNKIFQSQEFLKDVDKYQIMMKNFTNPLLQLYSDESNYVICRGENQYPVWIWTKDNVDSSILIEIEQAIRIFLLDNGKTKFTCKEEIYESLLLDGFNEINTKDEEDYFKLGFLKCLKTTDLLKEEVMFDRPNKNDLDVLTNYIYEFNNMMGDNIKDSGFTKEQAFKKAKDFINENTAYVLRNVEGKIVSMAHYVVSGKYGKIGAVFTEDNERGKGYAAYLIKKISDIVLEQQLVPSLYTDCNYPNSNKAYIKAGFIPEGYLINFTCSKQKDSKNYHTTNLCK